MKTRFIITADTDEMTVTLTVKQAGKLKYNQRFETVTDAILSLGNGIAAVMEKRKEEPE